MKGKYSWIMLVLASIIIEQSLSSAYCAEETTRITTSIEIRHVQPLLRRVSHQIDGGFTRADADHLADEIRSIHSETPMTWTYTVRSKGLEYPLQVRVLLDELGTVDLDFSTSPVLAPLLRSAVDSYLNAHNL